MFFNRLDNTCKGFSGLLTQSRNDRGTFVSGSATGVCSAAVARIAPFSLLCAAVLMSLLLLPHSALAVNIGDQMVNSASFKAVEIVPSSSTVTVTGKETVRTPATIDFLTYAPGIAGAVNIPVSPTYYRDASGNFVLVNPPVIVGTGTPIDLASPVPLVKADIYHTGEPLFVQVTDLDQDIDKYTAETIIVTITDPLTGDSETVQLTETGISTGVFVGYLQSTSVSTQLNNGVVTVKEDSTIEAHYTDIYDGTDTASTAALVDPYGLVFDTFTGEPVNGATVELLNEDGTPATVYGDNGQLTNLFPNSVQSGGTAIDSEGNSYSFTPGGYRFPFVNPGNYILKVTPQPNLYSSPSVVPTETIQKLPGAPFTIVDPGSRGQVFTVPLGPAIRVDLPVDQKLQDIWIAKTATKSIISAGEYLGYALALENRNKLRPLAAVVITDRLPRGFRYEKGTAKINGLPAPDPVISGDGRTMAFKVAAMSPATTVLVSYVVAVGAGATTGEAINTASATAADSVKSNIATVTVIVQEPFMQSRSIIMGRINVGSCSDDSTANKKGMEGVGIYLEDGTFVISDQFGMFHFEGVRPGAHVVQLDLDSIPPGYTVLSCEQNSRFAGRAYSQFVDLQGGTMWRSDFYLSRNEPAAVTPAVAPLAPQAEYKGEVTLEMLSSQHEAIIDYRLRLKSHTVLLKNLTLTATLPPAAAYIPGSSTFNGTPLPDPTITGTSLVFPLENAEANWQRELQFRAKFDKKSTPGELATSAVLTFDTSSASRISTPIVINTLAITREEKFLPLPLYVFRPHFPTFGAELRESDRLELDGLISKLSGKVVERIEVTGHTDNVRIAPRSRSVFADNTALSLARAKSVGTYMTPALQLPPAALYLNGSGDKEPLASNSTAEGRALNRRVEVNISALEKVETTDLKIIQESSGLKKQETSGGSDSAAIDQSTKMSSSPVATGASRKADTTVVPENKEEHAIMYSVTNESIAHYRLRLKNVKELYEGTDVTLILPGNLLYMAGTTQLNGKTVPDPEASGSALKYSFKNQTGEKTFDLRLQTLIDGDSAPENAVSMASIIVSAMNGKQVKTFNVTSQFSEDMTEITRPDVIPPQQQNTDPLNPVDGTLITPAASSSGGALLAERVSMKNEADEYHEKVESAKPSIASTVAPSPKADTGLHVTNNAGILSPADGTYVATQYNSVRLVLNSTLKPLLTLDGQEISAERIGFTMDDKETDKTLYVYIGIDFGDTGAHKLELKGLDPLGVTRFEQIANVIRTGEITSMRLVSSDGNVADGRTPVKMRIQLFDKDDKPVSATAEILLKSSVLRPLSIYGNSGQTSGTGAVSVDSQGWINFQPVNSGGNYRAQLTFNKAVLDVETYVKPKMRDWILVGLAEGTAGYNTVSGNMENLKSSDQKEDLYDKERLALYAKGTVKGEWLLTMAYDSAKKSTGVNGSNALFQTINPDSFYTIYADGSSQMYDAASQKKLYLKIERDQFYAMFGDFNTGLTVTELSRYSRSMTGIKSEYRSKDYDVTLFGSETAQSFVKDELRGDGTSGLYRLTRKGIVLNSDKITIESRDRFHNEIITDSQQLSRFIDYSIDYDNGTIYFKSPVLSRDDKLNPVYIVVDYEMLNSGSEALTYGGRAATRLLNGKVEVGGTYLREGQVSGDNQLYGVDATAMLARGTKARVEFATTDNEVGVNQSGTANHSSTTNNSTGAKQKASAYLAEVVHTGKNFDGRLYYREQEQGFGLSQQSSSETGTRKFGIETGYRLNEKVTLSGQAYRQYNLADDGVRDFIETLATYNEKQYTLRSGLRYANDTLTDGKNATSVLATVGGSWRTLNQRLTLRADHDQALFSKDVNTDFPTRTIIGIDFQATKATTIFAQEELTYGAAENTNTTRVGVKATPWSGGTLNSAVVNDMRENSERTFANVGLTQRWLLNPRWAVDGAIDHSETIHEKTGYTMNAIVPPASGGENFTAVSIGTNYTQKRISWSNRVEYRNSDTDDKWGLISGLVNEHGLDWAWTGRLQLYHTRSSGGNSSTNGDLRFGLVYRPPVTKWIVLNRLDLIGSDLNGATASAKGRRIINNLNANYKPNKKTQISFQYGAKYVLDKIDGKEYSGYTDLIGIEGRYDINKEWDIGARASLLHTWETDQYAYSFGPSVGYNVMENAWVSAGYNVAGFTDKDFSDANYTAQGPFVQYRFKFDQQSVKDGLKMLKQ